MPKMFKIKISVLAVFFFGSFQCQVLAEPNQVLNPETQQAQISAGTVPSSSSASLAAQDPTSQFLGVGPLQIQTTQVATTTVTSGLNTEEVQKVLELAQVIGIELQPPAGDMPTGIHGDQPKQVAIETIDRNPTVKLTKKANQPVAFLVGEYVKVQQKLQQQPLKEMIASPKAESVEPNEEELAEEAEIREVLKDETALEMKLEVTEDIVKTNEEFNLSKAHPMIDMLAMKGVSEENKEALMRAEAQRKAMAETAKQAEKTGKRVLFVVNGKIVPFFFNIPLFVKGDYHLYILNEKDLLPKIPAE